MPYVYPWQQDFGGFEIVNDGRLHLVACVQNTKRCANYLNGRIIKSGAKLKPTANHRIQLVPQ
jgi:hypothetical protein